MYLTRTAERRSGRPCWTSLSRLSSPTQVDRYSYSPVQAREKTTTLVESVVDRIERRGTPPDRVLVLTFSRKAAADLRTRITARLGRTVITPAMTFHAFCYALIRRFAPFVETASSVLTGPEQEFRVRDAARQSGDPARRLARQRRPSVSHPSLRG